MGFNHTFLENFKIAVAGTPGVYTATPQYANWVQLGGIARNATLISLAGELGSDTVVEVFEATDAAGTNATELTDITTGEDILNGVNEGDWGGITVRDDQLDEGYQYIGIRVTPVGANNYLAFVWVLGSAYDYPVDNSDAMFLVY